MKTSRTQFRPLHKMDVHNAHRQMWIEHIAKACFHDGVFLFFFFYADVHMPELSAEGDTVIEGLTLFMIKPYFFSREVCLGGQQRMRRQVWEELLCSYSALHAKQREREWGSKQSKARFLQHSIYSHISPHYGWSSEDLHPEESEIIPHHLPRGYLYLCLCQHLTQLNNR